MEIIKLSFAILFGYKNLILAQASKHITKMSSVMPFTFNAVELCIVTINEKPWTSAREVCQVLKYGKATKAADIVKQFCSRENYTKSINCSCLFQKRNL